MNAIKEREDQLAYHQQRVDSFLGLLERLGDKLTDWSYVPPQDDDPRTWKGATRWAAMDTIMRWHYERIQALTEVGKPCYCWQCWWEDNRGKPLEEQQKPPKGWAASKCLDHAWLDYLADEALNAARRLGAPVTCPSCGRRGNPGPAAGEHYAECTGHRRAA